MIDLTTTADSTASALLPVPESANNNVAPHIPDDLASEESSEQEEYSDGEDRDELRPTSHSLGITRSYVSGWTRQDAFRELYQNWKDAIITSFGLSQRLFKTQMKEVKDEIHILVYHPTTVEPNSGNQQKLLGYIRFKGKQGSVELTNFQAQLTRYNLLLGGTTKRNNNAVAGTHGEGLKVAALVLRREEHRVRLTSKNYNWTFGFRGQYKWYLYCRLTPVPERQMRQARKMSGNLKASPSTDVSILVNKARGEAGKKVTKEDFQTWIKVTLDIERPKDPTDIVETTHGDLILDESFAGRMYLKGLLLPNGGSNIKKLKAGYNLLQGHTNRDRERLKDEDEEAKTLKDIWEDAIEMRGDKILQRYIDLLQDHETCADVTDAENLISERTAMGIWERLKSQGHGKFYHHQKEDDSENIIKNHLKRQPASLSTKLWLILRRHSLVRTPQEQRIYLFRNSSLSEEPATIFSINVQRGLKASLALDERTQQVSVEYVSGAETDIDMLFDKEQQLLKIHEKWLNFTRIHETAPCRISMTYKVQAPHSVFLCDHVIEEIYEWAVHEIIESLTLHQGEALKFARSMRLKVRERLQQMPRLVSIKTWRPLEIVVTWTDGETELVREVLSNSSMYCVILHREQTCSQRRSAYLHQLHPQERPNTNNSERQEVGIDNVCECQRLLVSHASREALFTELNPQERYFPMIARAEESSFYAMPSEAVQPLPQPSAEHRSLTQPTQYNSSLQNMHSNPDNEHELTVNMEEQGHQENETSGPDTQTDRGRIVHLLPVSETRSPLTDRTRRLQQDRAQWQQEQEENWSSWEREKLQSSFDKFFSSRDLCPPGLSSIPSLASPKLGGYQFMMNEYVQVRLRPEAERADTVECVAYVYQILYIQSENENIEFFLLASRYSFLQSSFPFSAAFSSVQQSDGFMNRKELVLHFTDFDTMGERPDAEIIPVSKIVEARDLEFKPPPYTDPVQLLVNAPVDLKDSGFYCRFAIRSKVGIESACITPIGSHLLRHHERWRIPRYNSLTKPIIVDFSPAALGLAEGFSQEGYEVAAGTNFSTVNDMTWKARYPSAEVYDDAGSNVLVQIASGQLAHADWLGPGTVKVAVVGSELPHFETYTQNEKGLSLLLFYKSLLTVQGIMGSVTEDLNFDFVVCAMPATTLLPQVMPILLNTIHSLLKRRYSVHIQKIQSSEHGSLVDKNFIMIIASPVCTGLRWDRNQPELQKTLGDIIGDLAFQNPRRDINGQPQCGLQCKKPSATNETIYNHNTGTRIANVQLATMDMKALKIPYFRGPLFLHPTRKDVLTVRELARIYGFPDDFVFYNGPSGSSHYFVRAVPPTVARIAARAIRGIIEQCRGWEISRDPMENIVMNRQGSKRPRTES